LIANKEKIKKNKKKIKKAVDAVYAKTCDATVVAAANVALTQAAANDSKSRLILPPLCRAFVRPREGSTVPDLCHANETSRNANGKFPKIKPTT
jgi:hypothetical protein